MSINSEVSFVFASNTLPEKNSYWLNTLSHLCMVPPPPLCRRVDTEDIGKRVVVVQKQEIGTLIDIFGKGAIIVEVEPEMFELVENHITFINDKSIKVIIETGNIKKITNDGVYIESVQDDSFTDDS